GYDLGSKASADVAAEKTATVDLKLAKTKKLAAQLNNAEWMASIPGSEEQKSALLNCVGCHTLERVMRSTHDVEEWTHVIHRMLGYAAVSQPIKPQRLADPEPAGRTNIAGWRNISPASTSAGWRAGNMRSSPCRAPRASPRAPSSPNTICRGRPPSPMT